MLHSTKILPRVQEGVLLFYILRDWWISLGSVYMWRWVREKNTPQCVF